MCLPGRGLIPNTLIGSTDGDFGSAAQEEEGFTFGAWNVVVNRGSFNLVV